MIDTSTGKETAAITNQVPSSEDTSATAAVSNSAGDQTNGPDVQARLRPTRVALDVAGGDYHQDVEDGSTEKSSGMSNINTASPFELTTAKLWTSAGRTQASIRGPLSGRMAFTEVRRTREQEEGLKISLPYPVD